MTQVQTTETVEYINHLLDTERERKKYTNDSELARALGVSSKTLSMWRNGKSIPKSTVALLTITKTQEVTL